MAVASWVGAALFRPSRWLVIGGDVRGSAVPPLGCKVTYRSTRRHPSNTRYCLAACTWTVRRRPRRTSRSSKRRSASTHYTVLGTRVESIVVLRGGRPCMWARSFRSWWAGRRATSIIRRAHGRAIGSPPFYRNALYASAPERAARWRRDAARSSIGAPHGWRRRVVGEKSVAGPVDRARTGHERGGRPVLFGARARRQQNSTERGLRAADRSRTRRVSLGTVSVVHHPSWTTFHVGVELALGLR